MPAMQYKVEVDQKGPLSPGDVISSAAQNITISEQDLVFFYHAKCTGWKPGKPLSADVYRKIREEGTNVICEYITDPALKKEVGKVLTEMDIPEIRFNRLIKKQDL